MRNEEEGKRERLNRLISRFGRNCKRVRESEGAGWRKLGLAAHGRGANSRQCLRQTPRRAISSRAVWHFFASLHISRTPPPPLSPRSRPRPISILPFLLLLLLLFSPHINSGLYHNTFSHKKCHRRASLMAPEESDFVKREPV